ncbi:MAG: LysR family transcriptional regulator [Epsilonproteobacteria bacterium]|nr:LysR family transcriptional regulator [Campylobacterota bacterium]
MINLELYRTFIAIYREGTISKAAIAVDITQPAASQQLASLEKSLKVKLFERTPRRMVPSDAGHELYTKISDSFDWIDHVSQAFTLEDKKQTLFTIGVPLEYYHDKLIDKLQKFPFRLSIVFGTTAELARKFEKAKIDAMIATHKITMHGTIHVDIFTESFYVVAPKEMQVPKTPSKHWLMKQNWISYDAKLSIIRKYFLNTFQVKPSIAPILISPNLHTILKSVEAGVGLSVLPDYICENALKEERIALVDKPQKPITNRLYFVYKKVHSESLLVKSFLNTFQS